MRLLSLLTILAMNVTAAEIRVGLIGCDTSHATAFTQILNDPTHKFHVAGARVVAAVKSSSPDIESSFGRVDGYIKELSEKWGVRVFDSIEAMCGEVDAVFIESVDGRPHLAQARPVIAAKKPLFIDKPLAGSLADAREIARLAKAAGVPVWTGSAYRWYVSMRELMATDVGEIRGAISYGPAHLEKSHPDYYWYGIHPTEALYTALGKGCESVTRTKTDDTDVVVGKWSGGRTGTLIGLRTKSLPHKVTVFGSKGFAEQKSGGDDYAPLVAEIIKFIQTGKPPVDMEETLEMHAFMSAADESVRRGGAPVKLSEMK